MRVGYNFTVEGEYSTGDRWVDDPEERDWTFFETRDLHPLGQLEITIWLPGTVWDPPEEMPEELTDKAMTVIDWMRTEKRWWYFDATVYRKRGQDKFEKVGRFELV